MLWKRKGGSYHAAILYKGFSVICVQAQKLLSAEGYLQATSFLCERGMRLLAANQCLSGRFNASREDMHLGRMH
jgi:hypothetical protein